MTSKKFETEVQTLKKFFELYCNDKHQNQKEYIKHLSYNGKEYDIELNLCNECRELLDYSFDRLVNCPHEIKPRCRTCPTPCYEKPQWKSVAKLMRYSGMKLGMLKLRKMFKFK